MRYLGSRSKMYRVAILFSGKGSNMAHIVETLHPSEVEVVVALTNNPHAKGIEIAKQASIPLEIVDSRGYKHREEFDAEVVDRLSRYAPDLVVLAGFMRILTPVFTQQIRAINLHPSLLPRHKGLNAIERSYTDEYLDGGVTIHHVSSELDGGDIILHRSIPKANLSFEQYDKAIRTIEKKALVDAIRQMR